jgi:PHD/YefM family antitoxin component YafN of YafNO toxin-antitoxin module
VSDRRPTLTTFTSQEFDENPNAARNAAARGPVFIVDHGWPSHVLLSIEEYARLTRGHLSLAEALAQPGADFDFEPPKAGHRMFKPANFG